MRLISWALASSLVLAAGPAAAQPSPACKPIIDAVRKQWLTPSHAVFVSSGAPTVMEEIIMADATYVKVQHGWRKSPVSLIEVRRGEDVDIPKVYECRPMPDENLDGVPSSVFAVHTVDETKESTGKMWIAKGTGLPVKSETDTTQSGKKLHVITTWTYDNIHAPALP
jgi:hypothetical protein